MNIRKNARLTPYSRELLVRQIESGQAPEATARAAGVGPRTARKWLARFQAEGLEGLRRLLAERRRSLPLMHTALGPGRFPRTLSFAKCQSLRLRPVRSAAIPRFLADGDTGTSRYVLASSQCPCRLLPSSFAALWTASQRDPPVGWLKCSAPAFHAPFTARTRRTAAFYPRLYVAVSTRIIVPATSRAPPATRDICAVQALPPANFVLEGL